MRKFVLFSTIGKKMKNKKKLQQRKDIFFTQKKKRIACIIENEYLYELKITSDKVEERLELSFVEY